MLIKMRFCLPGFVYFFNGFFNFKPFENSLGIKIWGLLYATKVLYERLFSLHLFPVFGWFFEQRTRIFPSTSATSSGDTGDFSVSDDSVVLPYAKLLSKMSEDQALKWRELEREYEEVLDENCQVFAVYFKQVLVNENEDATISPPWFTRCSLGVSNCYVFKSRLQEYAHKAGLPTPVYETIKEGPSHEPSFRSTVIVNDVRYDSVPGFFNRKAAEQSVAEVALVELANRFITQPVRTDNSRKKSTTHHIVTSYLQPLLLWTGAILICRALEPVKLPTVSGQVVKERLLHFVRSLSSVLAFAYCLSSVIQQAQKFVAESVDASETRNVSFLHVKTTNIIV